MMFFNTRAKIIACSSALFFLFLSGAYFFYCLRPVSKTMQTKVFEIRQGESFFGISSRLQSEGLIRSAFSFELYAVLTGSARKLMVGVYDISGASSTPEIISLIKEPSREVTVRIPDGASVYDIDKLLSGQKVLPGGALREFASMRQIEGELYPDTYEFFRYSKVEDVVDALSKNFQLKAGAVLGKDLKRFNENLIIASLVQKEVSDFKESRIVAGILKKRLSVGMALGVDATICYLKKEVLNESSCYPLKPSDFKIDSPYNTYLYAGLPAGPIGSPEISAIRAVLDPLPSPYWYYLSDPKTGKTIFSKTLEEHSANRAKYLR
ncbi:MAG: endolytic transglycosylase MltG [Candidatus Liptonbacteria bacterium]|nr:endolytic transglycosylase MltG [Candidatus Liptonbacteria bacterium]